MTISMHRQKKVFDNLDIFIDGYINAKGRRPMVYHVLPSEYQKLQQMFMSKKSAEFHDQRIKHLNDSRELAVLRVESDDYLYGQYITNGLFYRNVLIIARTAQILELEMKRDE